MCLVVFKCLLFMFGALSFMSFVGFGVGDNGLHGLRLLDYVSLEFC